jgi:hypothetical protein
VNNPKFVKGGLLGVTFPTTIESLREEGAAFLTKAFHASGVLSEDNAVAAIIDEGEFFGGGMGRKLLLTVAFERPVPGLRTKLFVKFPRDFGDPLRELFAPLMEPETRFALLSRQEGFPIAVPKCFFAEFDASTKSGILITERIGYGQDGIEPAYEKCMDYRLQDPLRYYKALAKAMAKLAGYHKKGRLGPDVDAQFPRHQLTRVIPYGESALEAKLAALREFADKVPHLFPDELGSRSDIGAFAQEALMLLRNESSILAHLNHQPDQTAFCHLNTNVDNAWFWTGPGGEIQAGLLDWGGVGQMHLGSAFYGLICSAETDFLNAHRQTLISLIAAEYRNCGGPAIDVGEFTESAKLACGLLGLAWMMDAPALVAASVPDYWTIKSRFDPKLQTNFLARVQLQPLIVLLNEWRNHGIGAATRRIVARG